MNQQFRIKHVAMYKKSALKNVNLAVNKFWKQTSSKFRRQFLANLGGNEKIYLLISRFLTRVFPLSNEWEINWMAIENNDNKSRF